MLYQPRHNPGDDIHLYLLALAAGTVDSRDNRNSQKQKHGRYGTSLKR